MHRQADVDRRHVTVAFAALPVVMRRDVVDAVRLATRDAVNQAGALPVTQDAREGVRAVLGPEQRMSRLTKRLRTDQGGRIVRVSAATIAAGGTRINPYYRQADSKTHPVALCAARGPAHLIEHDRRGGYRVAPGRSALSPDLAATVAEAQGRTFGRSRAEVEATTARLQHRPAIPTPYGFFASVRPGPIRRPRGGPITKAFKRAPTTIDRGAATVVDKRLTRELKSIRASALDVRATTGVAV